MARTIQQIQDEIITAKENEIALQDLNSTSKTAIWRLQVFIVSVAIWALEKLFDAHMKEVDEKIKQLKPHTARWYRNKALAFQYGFDLLEDSDQFDNENANEEQIEESKVIKYSAVTEAENESRLIIKIATEQDEVLSPVEPNVLESFTEYIAEIKDAGVMVSIINYLPDLLKLKLTIVRDKLVLDTNGMDINTGKYPVNDAIQKFMKELPFNGELSLQKLVDRIQAVPGVLDLNLDEATTAWIDPTLNGYGDWETIYISKIPTSGYFAVNLNDESNQETLSTINYI